MDWNLYAHYGGTKFWSAWQTSCPVQFATVRSGSFTKAEAQRAAVEEKEAPVDADALKAKLLTQRKRSLKLLTWKVPMSS